MTITIETVTPQIILELAQSLSPADQGWLLQQLSQLGADDLPEKATLDEALRLYQAGRCSLGRAAELAEVTRWELQALLQQQGTPVEIYGSRTAGEIDALAEELEAEGIL
ncbi:MAG: hypothetical protein HC875_06045 [Anaerolineales bacterium]|nr:hypothetical protein [Anaerolineales bacterium]